MSTTESRTPLRPVVRVTAIGAAAVEGVIGALQLSRTDSGLATHDTATHVVLSLFAVALVAAIPLWLVLAQRAGTRWPGISVAAGNALLAVGATASNINGSDPEFFGPVAIVANAAVLVGLIGLAVACWRRRVLPRPLAAALPVYFLGVIPLAQLGGGLLRAAVLAAVLWVLATFPA
ncbi:hypothetical protein ACFQE5_22485 [Pseudonocardia hispaniensis]|uniref:Low temperature requirement A protein (LtrA) n=1 Tax=Pseudonocardia hispaniensis TaxID=904933 RepID=A0ABW1J7W4_9PSEU